jgi:hypothetical protein
VEYGTTTDAGEYVRPLVLPNDAVQVRARVDDAFSDVGASSSRRTLAGLSSSWLLTVGR